MADNQRYRMSGSAAVNFSTQSTARPLNHPERLPEAPAKERRAVKVHAKMAVAPFTLVAGLLAFAMLFAVVFSYVRLYEAKQLTADLRSELSDLNEEHSKLLSLYESVLDIDTVEARAYELGMSKPGASQIVYVQVAAGNSTEIYPAPVQQSVFEQVCDAFYSLFHDAVEYFS